jgi:hypothetical protein
MQRALSREYGCAGLHGALNGSWTDFGQHRDLGLCRLAMILIPILELCLRLNYEAVASRS